MQLIYRIYATKGLHTVEQTYQLQLSLEIKDVTPYSEAADFRIANVVKELEKMFVTIPIGFNRQPWNWKNIVKSTLGMFNWKDQQSSSGPLLGEKSGNCSSDQM